MRACSPEVLQKEPATVTSPGKKEIIPQQIPPAYGSVTGFVVPFPSTQTLGASGMTHTHRLVNVEQYKRWNVDYFPFASPFR